MWHMKIESLPCIKRIVLFVIVFTIFSNLCLEKMRNLWMGFPTPNIRIYFVINLNWFHIFFRRFLPCLSLNHIAFDVNKQLFHSFSLNKTNTPFVIDFIECGYWFCVLGVINNWICWILLSVHPIQDDYKFYYKCY